MSWLWWKNREPAKPIGSAEERLRRKYNSFRELLALNNECLELMAGLQDDLQYVPPLRDVIGGRVEAIRERVLQVIAALERLCGVRFPTLSAAVENQYSEVARYISALQELRAPRLSAWLFEVGEAQLAEVGGKAAELGEVRRLGLPVPNGFVLTTEAYRQFCGIPHWRAIRDLTRDLDVNDLEAVSQAAARLQSLVRQAPVPPALAVAVTERALHLDREAKGLAVRSSAIGEGGAKTFAGQFLTLLNVPREKALDAYRQVIEGRFSERALSYRISNGILEIESPLAVLFLPMLDARAAGILYTRDPANPGGKEIWITATRGVGLDVASGGAAADLFVVSRSTPHELLDSHVADKAQVLQLRQGGGLETRTLSPEEASRPSLEPEHWKTLAEWGVQLERHFGCPQDVEWTLDQQGRLWILQTRPLALTGESPEWSKVKIHTEPILTGGRTIYPGRVSGSVFLADSAQTLSGTPEGAVVFLRKASPEIVRVFPRISGLVAEWGNLAGHAAALLREFRIPSVFLMRGAFERLHNGQPISLDAAQARVYEGAHWPVRRLELAAAQRYSRTGSDPISRRLLTLHLIDPTAADFRPKGCQSTHDVLRFSHERAVEAMFTLNDLAEEAGSLQGRQLASALPLNICVLDLGGGVAPEAATARKLPPEQILCRPFQALWRGISHPDVRWRREMPASLGDFASVMAGSLGTTNATRPLGERSFLIVGEDYFNLNARLAYHFTLIDACLSDTPSKNYISMRFTGGGATRERRDLRASMIEACLAHFGFQTDRRGDLVNAWYKRAPASQIDHRLDILGRLMACASQLDMYMTGRQAMRWYVEQFLKGNYAFEFR